MKEKLSPQEKKRLSYERDHRTHTGEDNRAMRHGWTSRKKRVNRKYRRKTDLALRKAVGPEQIDALLTGDDPTTRELIRKGLTRENNSRKWGVRTLGEVVKGKLERRNAPRETNRQRDERLAHMYTQQIVSMERDPDSKPSRELLRALGWGDARLHDFLRSHPEWLQRLNAKLTTLAKDQQKRAAEAKLKAEEKQKWRSPTTRRRKAE